jgi:23S rRNA pseudouridine2605 synthase
LITTPNYNVEGTEAIFFDGKAVPYAEPKKVWCYYKPVGYITSHGDPQGRPTVFEDIKNRYPLVPHVVSIGRLDLNSEGLLLLTNDGEFSRYAEHPKTGWPRTYRVRVYGRSLTLRDFSQLQKGLDIEGFQYGPIQAEYEENQGVFSKNQWIRMVLHEGKNREIRKVMSHFDLQVSRLIRIAYGPYTLGALAPHELDEQKIV